MRKAPNPSFYFDNQAELLWAKDMLLYLEIATFNFPQRWDGTSIYYSNRLAKRAIKALGNPYGYANSTFLSSLRRAILRIKRRRTHVEVRTSGREQVRPQSETTVGRRGDKASNTRPVRSNRKK